MTLPILNTTTLVEFEAKRKVQKFIPYDHEINTVGESKVNLVTIRALPSNPRFDLYIMNKRVITGEGTFTVSGDHMDPTGPYRYLTIEALATIAVYDHLLVTGSHLPSGATSVPGEIDVRGRLQLEPGSTLTIENGAEVIVAVGASIIFMAGSQFKTGNGGTLRVEGSIYIPVDMIGEIISSPDVIINQLATIKISETPSSRLYSLSDYAAEIKTICQPSGAHGSRSMTNGSAKASFNWVAGSLSTHVVDISVDEGEIILGDFQFSVLGLPDHMEFGHKSVANLTVQPGAILRIGTVFHGDTYYSPSLRLDRFDSSSGTSGTLVIHGKVIVDGPVAGITYTNDGTVIIEEKGELHLLTGATLNNLGGSGNLIINGKLFVDDLEQLIGSRACQIEFGPRGKIIVWNPSPVNHWERKLLFSTPDGIESSELYRLFGGRLEYVDYHVQRNCGIRVDRHFERMYLWDSWYNGVRLEKAIRLGYLIWHDGGYVEFDRDIFPALEMRPGLDQIGYMFKSYFGTAREKLQDLVDRLKFAGSGDMVFRIVDGDRVHETTLSLGCCRMEAASYNPVTHRYGLVTDNDGELFLRSSVPGVKPSDLIHADSKQISVPPVIKRTTFELP